MFEKDFAFGVATAAYQIEGAYNEDGKGLNIWDTFSHIDGKVKNNDNGDFACDHYHRYKEDVQEMVKLGIHSYRFSISWARVIPKGYGEINQAGIDFYNNLINELIANNIEPIVTLYHWDLPQHLQDEGGFTNPKISDYFCDYAREMFKHFGDRIKKWITFNEPWVTAFAGHHVGRHAPGIKDFKAAIQTVHSFQMSHAKIVNCYKKELKGTEIANGEIGVTLSLYPIYTLEDTAENKVAAQIIDEYHNKIFLDPIFKNEYPKYFMELCKADCGFEVSEEDMAIIRSAEVDFLGVNYYLRKVVAFDDTQSVLKFEELHPEGEYTDMGWEVFPEGLRVLLHTLRDEYGNPTMYITENGIAYGEGLTPEDRLKDAKRISYVERHLEQAKLCIEDGVNLKGYYLWSLFDNFEWAHGYNKRFGIIDINYDTFERTWKESAHWYKDYIAKNSKR